MKLYRRKSIADIKNTTTVRRGPKNYGNISYLNMGTTIIEQHVIVCCQQHSFDILQRGQNRAVSAAGSLLLMDAVVPGGWHPCLESIFSPNRFYSSFKVICQIIFPIYIVNESNPTNSF